MDVEELRRKLDEQRNYGWPPDFAFSPLDMERLIDEFEAVQRALRDLKDQVDAHADDITEALDAIKQLVDS